MCSLSLKKELLFACFLALYCIYYLISSIYPLWSYTTDDAYISWLYAHQLVNGNGLVWNINLPRVEGYSNFLWVLIAGLIMKLQLPLISTLKWISIFCLASGLFFLYRFSRLFFRPLLAMLPVLLFSHYQGVAWWTMSGLETSLYCSLAILLTWQCTKALGYTVVSEGLNSKSELSIPSWFITNLTLFFISLVRFEGLIWTVSVILFVAFELKTFGINHFFKRTREIYLVSVISLCCFIIPYIIYFIWRIHYFGDWIPNSYRCKSLTEGQIGIVDYDYFIIIVPLIVASLPYVFSKKDNRHILLWSPSVLYGIMLWKANPIITYFLRLFLAPFALFNLLPVLGISQFRLPKVIIALIVIVFTFIFIPGKNLTFNHNYLTSYEVRNQNRKNVAQILNSKAVQGATVFLNDTGIIPFYSRPDLRFIDSQCLNNALLSHPPYVNNKKLYTQYLQQYLKPDWVIVTQYPLEIHQHDYLIDLLNKQRFFNDYHLVSKLESQACLPYAALCTNKMVDFVYLIYKRNE